MKKILFFSILILTFSAGSSNVSMAQSLPTGDLMREYQQLLKMRGTLPLDHRTTLGLESTQSPDSLLDHPWSDRTAGAIGSYSTGKFQIAPYDVEFQNYWQSREPANGRDGAVWQGRGFTNALSTGFFMRYGAFSAGIRPTLIFTQNRSFELSPYEGSSSRSPYAYPLGNIDWPQRFGDGSFWRLDAGQSFIRADYHGWASGISNETMWWSPALQNALLLSDNAPGFSHFFIGTTEPKNIHIGHLQTKLFWGKLWESDYFDSNPENNERYITGGRIAFTPKPVPGLTVGINRIYYETIPPEGIPARDLLKVFEAFTKVNFSGDTNPGGNDEADQLISIFGSWIFPDSGLEIYGEWARTDHSWNWRDFITEPDHSRGYTIGLQKVFQLPENRMLSMNAELTQLEASKTGLFRGFPTFYVHGRVNQGYTNRGQLLGASIGPGSSSQYVGASYYFGNGKVQLWTQRVALNNDFLYSRSDMIAQQNSSSTNRYWLHNIEMRVGSSITYFYKQFETKIGLTVRRELNDDYLYKNDQFHVGLQLSLRYRLSNLR
ncbi:capsule assembly Wzi family protein [Aliifodinibius sp. S!AR15-10]|uniref:capsule assembly Wzi family protein n=1 Tax=Aliifodinibius sp. S!AR15-10 TaxID=2950437 RepID=UPI00285A34F1|nr:capsule assembly Wzi family protein [Aliifodinibius sp. S!AR15-10]MDR8392025.1 capsule assembly Wzi family protein [Aliifodinibius sp. S!AR15-10]